MQLKLPPLLMLFFVMVFSTFELSAQVLIDDFNRANNISVGNGWLESESVTNGTGAQIKNNQLALGSTTSGRDYIYRSTSTNYNPVLTNNNCQMVWQFNMRQPQNNPSGVDQSEYGVAFVLAASNSNITTGSGYAVVLGEQGGTDRLRLVRYANGFSNSNLINVISNNNDYSNEFFAVKVIYDPSNDSWQLFQASNNLSFPDPASVNTTYSRIGVTTIDNSLTSTNLPFLACFWNHANQNVEALFDNIYLPTPPPASPVVTSQNFLTTDNATIASLPNGGGNYKWYSALTGGTAIPSTTTLTSTTYYVSTTSGSCESERTAVNVTINKAQPTITWNAAGTITYGTTLNGKLNAIAKFNNVEVAGTYEYKIGTNAVTNTTVLDASTTAYQLSVTFTPNDGTNFSTVTSTNSIIVSKAQSTTTISLAAGPFTYTGSPITPATVSVTGAGGLKESPTPTYTNNTNAGTATVSYTFAGDANHEGSSATETFTIGKATANITLTNLVHTYDGTVKSATATTSPTELTGVSISNNGKTNAGTYAVTATLDNPNYRADNVTGELKIQQAPLSVKANDKTRLYNETNPTLDGALTGVVSGDGIIASYSTTATQATNVGEYAITATLNDPNGKLGNYEVTNTPGKLTITPAPATISLSDLSKTYNGSAQGATVTTLPGGLAVNITYDGSATEPTKAGDYNVVVSLNNTNYKAENKSGAFTINQATANVQVTGYTGTYDGAAHGATGTAIGVNNEDLSSLLNFGSSFTDYPGSTANWSFAGNTNYKSAGGSVAIVINKAAPTITLTIGDAPTYDGNAHSVQSATVSGVGGASLGNAHVVYKQGATIVEQPTNAGSYSVMASYAGSTNYKAAEPKTGTLVINKADAVVKVTGFSGTYDGEQHGATGKAEGIGGVELTGLNLGATFINAPGGTAQWTFNGGTNYNNQSGSVAITINKADATIDVTGFKGVYDSKAHGAEGSATGVKQEDLSSLLDFGNSFTNVPGGEANWAFKGNTNYNATSGTEKIEISARPVEVTADAQSKTYGDIDPALTYKVTNGSLVGEDAFTGALKRAAGENVGTYAISQNTLTAGTNYSLSFKGADLSITARNVQVTADAQSKTYGEADPNLTYKITSGSLVGSDAFTGSLSRTSGENVGTYAIGQNNLSAGSNYNIEYIGADLTISKRAITISADPLAKTYGENDPALTYQITSGSLVGEDALTGELNRASGENVGSYAINKNTLSAGNNYHLTYIGANLTISKADPKINVEGYSGVYDGAAHGATGTAKGVKGEDLSGLHLGASFTDVPGGTANWTFTDATGNYNNKSGSLQIAISKADQVITWANPANIIYGTALSNDQLNATALGGAVLTYTPAAGTVLGAGNRTLSVSAAATNNYNAASKEVMLVVEKATATISLSNLNHVYDGTVKNAIATTIPSGLSGVSISNNGKTDAGTYEVEATLNNDNYKAEPVKGNLFIDKASTSISVANVSGTTGGVVTISASITPALSGRTINFTLNGSSIGAVETNASGVATLNTSACTNNATIGASFAGESNYKASTNTATLSTVTPNYTWSGTNTSTSPIQLAGSGVTVTPVINLAGVTLTNATFDWDNGKAAVPVPGTLTDKFAPGSFTYTTAGVYAPKLVGKDACGNTVTIRLEYLVIYDPNGGFVTGGGWIYSPKGAYRAEQSSEGKATFGFVAKYKKGSTSIVEGETEFQFHAGNLKFNSTAYDNVSLVVGGAKASYKGTGTINGTGSYKFMLTAIDGQVTGGGGQDKLRMKITDASGNVVYDNMMDALESATPTTALGGGSIVIHEAKATKKIDARETLQLNRLETETAKFDLQAFPNPSASQFNLKVQSNVTTEKITLRVVDISGRTVQLLHNLTAGQTVQIGGGYKPGVYFVEMIQGNNRIQTKLLKQPH